MSICILKSGFHKPPFKGEPRKKISKCGCFQENRGCWVIVGLVGSPEEQISGRAVWGIATLHHHMHSPGTTKPRDSGSGHCLPWCLLWHRTRNHLWLPPMPQLKLALPLRLEAGIVATLKCLLTQQMPKLLNTPLGIQKASFFSRTSPTEYACEVICRETNYSYPIEQGMITSANSCATLAGSIHVDVCWGRFGQKTPPPQLDMWPLSGPWPWVNASSGIIFTITHGDIIISELCV